MLSFASFLLLGMAVVMAVVVAIASRALLRGERAARAHPELVTARGRVMGRWVQLARTVEQRFVPGSALGLQLTVSVLVSLAALWFFAEIADNVIDQDELFRFDTRVMLALAPLRTTTGLGIAAVVSRFGTVPVMSVIALVIMLALFRRNWRAVTAGWVLVMGGGKLVEAVLKHTFHRQRPAGALRYLHSASYSYPSGHSMGSMIGYGLLAYLVLRRVQRPAGRAAVTMVAALAILAVGFSRLVLAVHFFTDVIGGFAAGAVWLALSLAAVEAARERSEEPDQPGHRRAA